MAVHPCVQVAVCARCNETPPSELHYVAELVDVVMFHVTSWKTLNDLQLVK